jgi:SAM-dependent methyltransferase
VPANVEVRRHDIVNDDIDADAFDLVHSRCVLIHLPDPGVGLSNMVRALKPGGWIALDEADWGLFSLAGHADAEWATGFVHDLFMRHVEAGVRYPYFGRRLAGLLTEHGLDEVSAQGTATVSPPGDLSAEVIRLTFDALRALNRSVGASDEDLDRLAAVLESPGVTITAVTLMTARGRKPA